MGGGGSVYKIIVVIPKLFMLYFVQPLELKLKICPSILFRLFHFNYILVAYIAKNYILHS